MVTARGIVEFLDVPTTGGWSLTPEEAIAFLQAKGLRTSLNWQEVIGAEHARAFTVAKMMDADMLADVKASLDDALANGVAFDEWAKGITPMLQAKGWWGMKQVVAPGGGLVNATLGSPSRLQTIYRTNMQSAYAAGQWDGIVAQMDEAPYLMYDAVDDLRTRPQHHAWDNTVLKVTDPWWNTHYPPNGWNCRCNVIQLSKDDLESMGIPETAQAPDDGTYTWTNPVTGKRSKIPNGLDPGWNTNVGEARSQALAKAMADKLAGYPADIRVAAAEGFDAARVAGADAARFDQAAAIAHQAELDTAALARAAMKSGERTAAATIDKHLADNTPYLAKSIKAVKGTKAGASMSNTELLEAAQAHASKTEAQAALANYKQSLLAGKTPSAKGKAAFDALPEEAATAITEQINATLAKKAAEAEADDVLSAIVMGKDTTLEAKALAKVTAKSIADGVELSKVDMLAQVQAEVAAAKAKQVTGQLLGGAKKALVAGKNPTPAQLQAMKALQGDDLSAFLAKVEAEKTALLAKEAAAKAAAEAEAGAAKVVEPVPVTPSTLEQPFDPSKFVQIGPQKGSNPGGLYLDESTGTQWYIKVPPSVEQARNEVLAGKLYEAAGVQVPELRLTTLNGQPAVASRIVDGLGKTTGPQLAKTAGAIDNFATDAWLANWDVAGATFDNMLVKGGQAIRVDTGGALRFRAQGAAKGNAFGNTVTELDSLRDASTNRQTAAIFGKMTEREMQDSARRLLAIDRNKVDALVDQFGPVDLGERSALKATLRARLDSIATQLKIKAEPVAAPPAPVLVPGGKFISHDELAKVKDSRANGYTISTDGGQIEDHQVLLQHYTDAKGVPSTRLVTKLRGSGAQAALQESSRFAVTSASADLSAARESAVALAKSINSRAAKGATWDATIDTRLATWAKAYEDARTLLGTPLYADAAGVAETKRALEHLNAQIRQWRTLAEADKGKALPKIVQLETASAADVKPATPKAEGSDQALSWNQANGFDYALAKFDKGAMTELPNTERLPEVSRVMVGEGDGVRVRFIPDIDANSISSRGLVHIDVAGTGAEAVDKAIKTLADLGVTTTRTTDGERLGLYLDKVANLRGLKNAKLRTAYAKADTIADEAARNAKKLEVLNKDVGYDLTTSPHWNPDGKYQAFGHGRTIQMRPDLDDATMKALENTTAVYTNVTNLGIGADSSQWNRLLSAIDGGGTLSSQMDRARRGIASNGSSVWRDHQTGGANYVFTRLVGLNQNAAGVYFKPSILRRIDAFSYDGDVFGNVSASVQKSRRAVTSDGMLANRSRGGNETNFRDGISLFDDLDRIIFSTKAEQQRAIADMKARGYKTWPDGRQLEEVLQGPRP